MIGILKMIISFVEAMLKTFNVLNFTTILENKRTEPRTV